MPSEPALAAVPERRAFPSRGRRVIRFIERYCVYTKGKWAGRPFKLLPWQRDWIMALFEVDPETRRRRYRWALLGVPKKNGKTELVAALGLYFLIADDEPTPEVVCAAASREQAGLIFEAAKYMAEHSPRLAEMLKVWTNSIDCPETEGTMYVVAAADGANDGKNISALLIDELHEWTKPKSLSIYTILTGGAQWRDQPITIQITTAGVFDEAAIWYREYKRGKAIEAGEIDDPSYFFRWYEAPEGADYKDPEVWRQCNPSFDHLGMERVLRDLLTKRTPNQFRRYHLNQATDSVESWLPEGAWDECRVRTQQMDRHADTWLAVDASATSDSCSVTWGQWMMIEEAARFLVRTRIWQPPLDEHTGREVDNWNMPHAEIENFIRELAVAFEVKEIAYDPYNFRRSKDILEDEGLPMLEFPQHPSRTAPATKLMRDSVISHEIAHEGSGAMRAQVVAAVTVPVSDVNESFRLSKGKSKKRIDVAASLMMLLGTALTVEEEDEAMPAIRFI